MKVEVGCSVIDIWTELYFRLKELPSSLSPVLTPYFFSPPQPPTPGGEKESYLMPH
jgi:hypothetical protein